MDMKRIHKSSIYKFSKDQVTCWKEEAVGKGHGCDDVDGIKVYIQGHLMGCCDGLSCKDNRCQKGRKFNTWH